LELQARCGARGDLLTRADSKQTQGIHTNGRSQKGGPGFQTLLQRGEKENQ
jgi:hypothetical protein